MAEKLLPLILIHGYPLDHRMWFGVIAALGSGIRVLNPDLPGFGKAAPPEGEPSIDTLAKNVLALLKREKIERAVIAGMSMGGYVALALAEKAPEKVAGLALINSQTYADTEEARTARRELIKTVRAQGPGAAARAAIPKMFTPARSENPDFQRFVLDGAEAAGVEGICWALEAMARRPDRSQVVAEAKFPVLIVHSTDDRFIPIAKAEAIAALNPEAFFVPLKGFGHGVAMGAPDEVAAALRKFLEICSKTKEDSAAAKK